ncbi:hypothetical protein [Halorubrum vacuolatum]|uniref:DUF8054 domain-containing protein n=1 Tax=Halorubrum vacuolatum TaxID=63740 RepID=A0A238XF32_HALVU|nr:hypothetical protein [Halorubrum vacuolatum]SNR57292.1 hypothetical protein SAMN06264855_1171 [Halorubrum vacuolatum]
MDTSRNGDGAGLGGRQLWESLRAADVVDAEHRLTPPFYAEWQRLIAQVRGPSRVAYLARMLETQKTNITIETGEPVIVMDGTWIAGEWPSVAAVDADVGLFIALQRHVPGWDNLRSTEQRELLAHLRVCLSHCPSCDAELRPHAEISPSEVPTIDCSHCGAQLS